jgi:dolichol-phosphate mannosyltransferase
MRPIAMVPTYNEAGNIERLIAGILSRDGSLEVVVVDDDSPDGTAAIVSKLAVGERRVHLLHRRGVRGRASAGIAGFQYALDNGYDVILEMDADFSHDPAHIPQFLSEVSGADIVVGSRYVSEGRHEHRIFPQYYISLFANAFNNLVLGLHMADTTGGYRCYRTKVFEKVKLHELKAASQGYAVGAEILYKAKKAGFTVKEMPIVFQPRAEGKSKLNWRLLMAYPLNIIKIRLTS